MNKHRLVKTAFVSHGSMLANTAAQAVPDQPTFRKKCAEVTKKRP